MYDKYLVIKFMIDLPFIQEELTEARLFFGPKDIKGMSAEEIADLVYIMMMMLEVIRHSYPSWAASYASDTMRYNTYDAMHYSGTDLGNLIAVLNNQDTFKGFLKSTSGLSVPLFQINRYLGAVRSMSNSHSEDATFFYRLEDYLKLYSKSLFRQLRRDIGNWGSLTRATKQGYVQLLRKLMDSHASNCDMYLWFRSSYQLKESVNESIDTKLEYHTELNPALWDENDQLHDDVKDALGKIANKFSEFLDVNQLKIVDYIITGSNCAFNYTSQSDIDLHVLVDASKLGKNPLTDPFLMAKKSLWNSGHDITVKGYTVELYAEDINKEENQLVATGIYSLLDDKWVKKPEYVKVSIDDAAVQSKAEDIIGQIESIIRDPSGDINDINKLWDHIRKMRRAGLEHSGEFSVENLAFKAVRNNGAFDRLREYEQNMEDDDLTLEQTELTEIDAADYAPPLSFSPEQLTSAKFLNTTNNFNVYETQLTTGQICYFTYGLINKAEEYPVAWVVIDPKSHNGYYPFVRIENNGIKGLGTALAVYVVVGLGKKITILPTEQLTPSGLEWISKLITAGGRGLTITDQDGNTPMVADLKKEWNTAYKFDRSGPTQIFIENKSISLKKVIQPTILESTVGSLLPMCNFVGDKRLY